MNKDFAKINETLVEYCKTQNIDWIDLNPSLSDETGLKKEYTTYGTHLKEQAYTIWSKILMEYLEQHK
jgi:lysophospholipase L1-like esterase